MCEPYTVIVIINIQMYSFLTLRLCILVLTSTMLIVIDREIEKCFNYGDVFLQQQ